MSTTGDNLYGPGELKLPPGTIISDAKVYGPTTLYDAQNVEFRNCEFIGPDVSSKGILIFLGGRGFTVRDSHFSGGIQAGQLSIGLNSRVSGGAALPYDWVVENCTFDAPVGQWGTYPQSHHIYNLADPSYAQNGLIKGCTFSGHPYGYCVKIGGTGNQPRTEGSRGVVLDSCTMNGVLSGPGGRAGTMLTQGDKSDVSLVNCTLTASGAAPYVEAADGARLRMADTILPQGVVEMSSWYYAYFFKQSKKVAVAPGSKPPNIGGISWV